MTRLRAWLPLFAVAGLVVLAAAVAAAVDPRAVDVELPRITESPTTAPVRSQAPVATTQVTPPEHHGTAGGDMILRILAVAVGFVLAAITVFVLVMIIRAIVAGFRNRHVHDAPIVDSRAQQLPDVDEVRAVVRAGLADIDETDDPRRAVIACWLRLEHAAAGIGLARMVADTPADLANRLLAAHDVDDVTLRRLADLYRQARYAPDEVSERLRADARRALTEVDARLAAAARPVGAEAAR